MTITRYKRVKVLAPKAKDRKKKNVLNTLPVYLLTDHNAAETNIVNCLPVEDRYSFARLDVPLSIFCRNSIGVYIGKFIQAAVLGDLATVLKMLERHPSLLLERGHVKRGKISDHSEREFSGLTAYQILLCAGDVDMVTKLKQFHINRHNKIEDKVRAQHELDLQFNEVFTSDYEAHLVEQRRNVYNFDIVTNAIKKASPNELREALNNPDIGSPLGQTIAAFRQTFAIQSLKEKIFNPNHLLKALELFHLYFGSWIISSADDRQTRHLRVDLFWRQVIGFIERYLPTSYMQAISSGLERIVNQGTSCMYRQLVMRACITGYAGNTAISAFPTDTNLNCSLGRHFAVGSDHFVSGYCSDYAGGERSVAVFRFEYQEYVERVVIKNLRELRSNNIENDAENVLNVNRRYP